jgi:hypothetical protein
MEAIKLKFIRAVDKENMHIVISVLDRGDSFSVYMVFLVKTGFLWGMENRVGVSFENRAKALCGWLAGKVYE